MRGQRGQLGMYAQSHQGPPNALTRLAARAPFESTNGCNTEFFQALSALVPFFRSHVTRSTLVIEFHAREYLSPKDEFLLWHFNSWCHVPETHGPIITSRQDVCVVGVGAERSSSYHLRMVKGAAKGYSGRCVPAPGGGVVTARQDCRAVAAKSDTSDGTAMGETPTVRRFGFGNLPAKSVVFGSRHDGLVVRTEGHSPNWPQMRERFANGLTSGYRPKLGLSACPEGVSRTCRNNLAVGTDGQRQNQLFMTIQLAQWLA